MQKAVFLAITLATVALAGCTDEPPSGTFTATTPAADYSVAGIMVDAHPATNNYPQDDPTGTASACQLDEATGNDETGTLPRCEDAYTTIALTPSGGATLPLAGEPIGYTLYIISEDGIETEIGALEHHGEGHYDFPEKTFDEDYSGALEVQLRFGETVVATADTPEGAFQLAQGLVDISADITFDGAQIDVTLTGVPEDTPLVAWLVDIDEEGAKTHAVQFLLGSNQTSHTLSEEEGFVSDYNEFHVHVGASLINIAVAPIPSPIDE